MEWWKKSVIYQIYPKSFQDSNHDGIGDIQGMRKRLPYLKKLGVDLLWITPMYCSPQKDNGYDISNYYEIDPMFGTMEDFDIFLHEAHQLGLKIMMDIVVNHTSTSHPWFQDILAKHEKSAYWDYYILRKEIHGEKPNNWESMFGGSAWESLYDDVAYLHLFDVSQADLNWECDALRADIYEMMRYWMKKGVDGFRLDVINLISKQQTFLDDETSSPKGKCYYANGPRIHEFLQEMNREVFSLYNCVTVGEMMSMTPERAIEYTLPTHQEVNMIFSFQHLKVDYQNQDRWSKQKPDIQELIRILSDWQVRVNEGNGWNSLVWSNHDQPRVVSRFGDEGEYRIQSAKMLATAMHLLKGTPYIYQGEEIGMVNSGFKSIDHYLDIESLNIYQERLKQGIAESVIMEGIEYQSRDNARTPMQWNMQEYGGFSDCQPWIEIGNRHEICVENALMDETDIFYHYQKLIELRKNHDLVIEGDFILLDSHQELIWCYLRTYGNETWLVVSNFSNQALSYQLDIDYDQAFLILSNYEERISNFKNQVLRPFESIIYEVRKSCL